MLINTPITSPKNSAQPIGVFDSGVGGLSIVNCIKEQLPNEQLIYIADSLHAPYGDKPDSVIIERVNIIADELLQRNCKALVIACNTATVIASHQLRARLSIPIIGIEPAIKPAAITSKNKKIAILTTQATAKNQRFLNLVDKFKMDSNVHIQPCPGLVELIENNRLHSPEFEQLLQIYLSESLAKNVDTIVLGCTHYPFFADKIKAIVGNNIMIMETALPVTEQLKRQLIHHKIANVETCSIKSDAQYAYFSSQANNALNKLMSTLLNTSINLSSINR